jgi:hypothetical protein
MAGHDLTDTYIPYGRGGAGNMRKSSISITNNAFHHTSDYPHLMPSRPLPDTNLFSTTQAANPPSATPGSK